LKEDARSSVTYLLSESNWLTFSIPSFTSQLKFLSTANLLPADLDNAEESSDIRYSIEYELLDGSGGVLLSKVHHLRTAFLLFKDDNQSYKRKSFYLDSPLQPTMSETFNLALHNHSDAVKVRMKLHSKDSRIEDVGIRSYHLEKTSQHRKKLTWERMSEKKQEYLARGNVFSAPYLTQPEKQNLVSVLWRPNGPLGIENDDYKSRRLFILNESGGLHPYIQTQPKLYADARLHVSRFLKKGKYTITVTPISLVPSSIKLNYYIDKTLKHEDEYTMDKTSKLLHFESEEDGVIEIKSDQAISIRIQDESSRSPLDLPPVIARDYYKIDINNTIHYNFFSARKRFVRIECRSSEVENAFINIKMKDIDGKIVDTLKKRLTFTPSKYDYIEPFVPQSEPFYFYLPLSEDVNSLDIASKLPIALRLSSRSSSVPYPLYSFSSDERPEYKRLAGWFSVRPEKFNELKIKEREIALYKQIRPPMLNPLIKEGKYHYEQLYPNGQWRAHEILLVRPLGAQFIRSQSWRSLYAKVSSKKKNRLVFKDDTGLKYTTPRLIYQKAEVKPEDITVYLDNVVVLRKTLYARSGVLNLPAVSTRKPYTLHFKGGKNVDLLISNTSDSSQLYLKRQFIAFDKPMHFSFEKRGDDESIGLQLAVDAKEGSDALKFGIDLQAEQSFKNLSYASLSFNTYRAYADISQQKAGKITYNNQTLSVSDPIYTALGENLKPGRYMITVYPPKGVSKSYLYINHIALDKRAKTRINKEIL